MVYQTEPNGPEEKKYSQIYVNLAQCPRYFRMGALYMSEDTNSTNIILNFEGTSILSGVLANLWQPVCLTYGLQMKCLPPGNYFNLINIFKANGIDSK